MQALTRCRIRLCGYGIEKSDARFTWRLRSLLGRSVSVTRLGIGHIASRPPLDSLPRAERNSQ
jgi:hypothetical protein